MKVLVDTCIWSVALRRKKRGQKEREITDRLSALIGDMRVVLIDAVRQEVLSGIKDETHFTRVRDHLRAFNGPELTAEVYETAARYFNLCRASGIQGSNTDFLICAAASLHDLSIFTTDRDFRRFGEVLDIALFE